MCVPIELFAPRIRIAKLGTLCANLPLHGAFLEVFYCRYLIILLQIEEPSRKKYSLIIYCIRVEFSDCMVNAIDIAKIRYIQFRTTNGIV